MRNILILFYFCLGAILLCNSCKKELVSTHSVLLIADSLMWTYPDSALLLLEQITDPQLLEGADGAQYALLLTQARYKSCVLLNNDSLIRIAVDYYENSDEKERLAKSYFYQGCVYAEKKALPEAVNLYLKALEIMKTGMDSTFVAMIYSHLGYSYNAQGFREIARDMHTKCYTWCTKKDSIRAYYALDDIGDAFLLENRMDSALHYYQQSLDMALPLQNSELLSIIYSDLAGVYKEQGKYSQAEKCISRALDYSLSTEDYMLACSTKGDILVHLNQNDSAIHYWSIATASSNIYVKASSYDHIYREYKKKQDWESAILYADSFLVCYDSIRTMNNRAELDSLMNNHLVELHKQKLSSQNQRTMACLIIFFVILLSILIILYMWKDRIRKKQYMVLQQRLMENHAKTMLLYEELEDAHTPDIRGEELQNLEEERMQICTSLFRSTEGYKRLCELEKASPKERIDFVTAYRQVIVNDLRKTFAHVMENLKGHCSALTTDDLLYCILSLLQSPKNIILEVMNVSADAIKTRKSRIKSKMETELFERIFNC